jgi:DNA repair protein RecN (Recombination protein N)
MLTTLQVKNLALVENIRVDFKPGLNVVTGETGAGKSILIGALSLLLGDRADRALIRAGEESCGAEAMFHLPDSSDVDLVLEECGLNICEEGQLIIRRHIKASGSSQNWINDNPVTLQVLKRVGERLVDMHGPHDHQSLLSPEFQVDLLDAFGHLWKERAAYEDLFRRIQSLEEKRVALNGMGESVEEQMDLLKYRIKEIEEAAPVEGEEEKVRQEHLMVGNAQRILELSGGVLNALSEGEGSAFDALAGAQKNLEELTRLAPDAKAWQDEAREAAMRIRELCAAIHSLADRVESDPARLDWLDQRLATYQRLKKKYAPTVLEILDMLNQSKERLHTLQTRGEQLAALGAEIEKARQSCTGYGTVLRKKRQAAATNLAEAVTRELRALGFSQGSFSIDLRDAEPRLSGLDDVEFGFAPNVGEPMRPLRAIASSGEISRVMLATKVALSAHDRIPVMVFDEIDANVGGETGNAVGRKLAEVAKRRQVICITHLPQVAVFGTNHLAVTKSVRDGRTTTEVEPLAEKDRVEEVARMLGGRDLTSVTLKHAREMIESVSK